MNVSKCLLDECIEMDEAGGMLRVVLVRVGRVGEGATNGC